MKFEDLRLDQQQAINLAVDFITSDKKVFIIGGLAKSGKTTVAKVLYKKLKDFYKLISSLDDSETPKITYTTPNPLEYLQVDSSINVIDFKIYLDMCNMPSRFNSINSIFIVDNAKDINILKKIHEKGSIKAIVLTEDIHSADVVLTESYSIFKDYLSQKPDELIKHSNITYIPAEHYEYVYQQYVNNNPQSTVVLYGKHSSHIPPQIHNLTYFPVGTFITHGRTLFIVKEVRKNEDNLLTNIYVCENLYTKEKKFFIFLKDLSDNHPDYPPLNDDIGISYIYSLDEVKGSSFDNVFIDLGRTPDMNELQSAMACANHQLFIKDYSNEPTTNETTRSIH